MKQIGNFASGLKISVWEDSTVVDFIAEMLVAQM